MTTLSLKKGLSVVVDFLGLAREAHGIALALPFPLVAAGCIVSLLSTCSGRYIRDPVFLRQAQPLRKEPEIITVTLKKQNGMGLSIVAAKVRCGLVWSCPLPASGWPWLSAVCWGGTGMLSAQRGVPSCCGKAHVGGRPQDDTGTVSSVAPSAGPEALPSQVRGRGWLRLSPGASSPLSVADLSRHECVV